MSDAFDALFGGAQAGLLAAVGPVSIRTNLNADAPVILDLSRYAPVSGAPPAPPNALLSLLKPEVRVSVMGEEVVLAPYGAPSANMLPLLFAGAGTLVFALVGVGGLIGRFASPKFLVLAGLAGIASIAYVASRATLEKVV